MKNDKNTLFLTLTLLLDEINVRFHPLKICLI